MNKGLENILSRNSPRELSKPIPSAEEMEQVYQAALRAPDHAWQRPSRFIEVKGEGIKKLSSVFKSMLRRIFLIYLRKCLKNMKLPHSEPL